MRAATASCRKPPIWRGIKELSVLSRTTNSRAGRSTLGFEWWSMSELNLPNLSKADLRTLFDRFEDHEHNVEVRENSDPAAVARSALIAGQPRAPRLTAKKPCAFNKSVPTYFLFSKSDLVIVDITPRGLNNPEETDGLTFEQLSVMSQEGSLFLNFMSQPRDRSLENERFLAYHQVGSRAAYLLDPANGHHIFSNDARKLLLFKALCGGKGLDHYRGIAEAMGLVEAVRRMRSYVIVNEAGSLGPVGRLATYRGKIDEEKLSENIAYMLAYLDARPDARDDDAILTEHIDSPGDLLRDPALSSDFVSRVYTFHARRTAPLTGGYGGYYPRDWESVGRQALNEKNGDAVLHGHLRPADIASKSYGEPADAGLLEFLFMFSRQEIGRNLDTMHLPLEAAAIRSQYGLSGVIRDQERLNAVIEFMSEMRGPADRRYLTRARRHFAEFETSDLSAYDHLRALADAVEGREALRHWRWVKGQAGNFLGAAVGAAPVAFPALAPYAQMGAGIPMGFALNVIAGFLESYIGKGLGIAAKPWMRNMLGPHAELIDVVGTLTEREI